MQTMLRMVGFGDNAGSGFPTILHVWNVEGWVKPELNEDTRLNQVTLTLKMVESAEKSAEKSADKKVSEKSAGKKVWAKSADKKITPKTQEQYNIILENMKENEWYKSRDFCDILGVKETRVKELFRGLSKDGKIIDNDKTKGRMYKKI